MTPLFVTYLLYLTASVSLTLWVATTLFRNGRIFLVDVFHGNEALAASVNHLLVVGFYLVNLGYICLNLKIGIRVADATESVEALSWKVGLVLLVLGGMHFTNLFVFSRIRRNAILGGVPPPVPPTTRLGRGAGAATPAGA